MGAPVGRARAVAVRQLPLYANIPSLRSTRPEPVLSNHHRVSYETPQLRPQGFSAAGVSAWFRSTQWFWGGLLMLALACWFVYLAVSVSSAIRLTG